MATYIFVIVISCYFFICAGLLNQVNSINKIKNAKPFIIFAPLVYLVLLLKSIGRFLIKRDNDSKILAYGYLHFKVALIIILFSYSQIQKECSTNRRRNSKKSMNYAEKFIATSNKSWNNMKYAKAC